MGTLSDFEKPGRELDHFSGKLIQSSIGEFWGVTQAVLLENSSKRKHLVQKIVHEFWGVTLIVLLEKSFDFFEIVVERMSFRFFCMSFPWFANKGLPTSGLDFQ